MQWFFLAFTQIVLTNFGVVLDGTDDKVKAANLSHPVSNPQLWNYYGFYPGQFSLLLHENP